MNLVTNFPHTIARRLHRDVTATSPDDASARIVIATATGAILYAVHLTRADLMAFLRDMDTVGTLVYPPSPETDPFDDGDDEPSELDATPLVLNIPELRPDFGGES